MTLLSSADLTVAARIEAAEAVHGMAITRAVQANLSEASFAQIAGGTAIFAGVGSPMTHALGIGMSGPVAAQEMERLEAFFRDRGSSCLIDLCPMADASVLAFVQDRPYRAIEFNNVLGRRIQPDETFRHTPGIRPVRLEDARTWGRVVSESFSEYMPVSDEAVELIASTCSANLCWLAGGEKPEAGAALGITGKVCLFAGDATLVAARRRGWQSGLIQERLAAAQQMGCDLAAVSVLPGSGSHRNYERAGFQLLYMRVNLCRELPESKSPGSEPPGPQQQVD